MTVTLYEITVPVFIKSIKTLKYLLSKGVADAKVDDQKLLDAKLIDDMGNLIYQIQRVSDTAKGLCVRIGKVENVALEDNEKTFADLEARLDATIKVLESVKPEDVNSSEDAEVIIKTRNGETKWQGKDYAINFALPNFYFHVTTAYALLRKEGIDVGKGDFLGRNTPKTLGLRPVPNALSEGLDVLFCSLT